MYFKRLSKIVFDTLFRRSEHFPHFQRASRTGMSASLVICRKVSEFVEKLGIKLTHQIQAYQFL